MTIKLLAQIGDAAPIIIGEATTIAAIRAAIAGSDVNLDDTALASLDRLYAQRLNRRESGAPDVGHDVPGGGASD